MLLYNVKYLTKRVVYLFTITGIIILCGSAALYILDTILWLAGFSIKNN